jgi:putative DNA primase/helicase
MEDGIDKEKAFAALQAVKGQIIACRGRTRLDACVDLVSSLPQLQCPDETVDNKPFYFNGPHATLHLEQREGRAYHPSPNDLLTKQSSVKYDPKATCPTWVGFIAAVMKQDKEKIEYLQRWCGYSLTGDIGEKAFLYY